MWEIVEGKTERYCTIKCVKCSYEKTEKVPALDSPYRRPDFTIETICDKCLDKYGDKNVRS